MNRKKCVLTVLLLAGLSLMTWSCTESGIGAPEESRDLVQAVRAVEDMTRPQNLRRSMFSAAYGDEGKPSDFVSYVFSDMGSAEWPPTEGSSEFDEVQREPSGGSGQTAIPAGVAILPLKTNPRKGPQVVVNYDDEAVEVVLTAYSNPLKGPVLERRVPFVAVEADTVAKQFFESNLQMGMSYRSF